MCSTCRRASCTTPTHKDTETFHLTIGLHRVNMQWLDVLHYMIDAHLRKSDDGDGSEDGDEAEVDPARTTPTWPRRPTARRRARRAARAAATGSGGEAGGA